MKNIDINTKDEKQITLMNSKFVSNKSTNIYWSSTIKCGVSRYIFGYRSSLIPTK